jgi:hypothetical protein
MPSTAQTPREKLIAFTHAQPLPKLATALLMLEAKPELDGAERLTRMVIIDSICERCPAADAAFDAWAASDDDDPSPVKYLTAAAMAS